MSGRAGIQTHTSDSRTSIYLICVFSVLPVLWVRCMAWFHGFLLKGPSHGASWTLGRKWGGAGGQGRQPKVHLKVRRLGRNYLFWGALSREGALTCFNISLIQNRHSPCKFQFMKTSLSNPRPNLEVNESLRSLISGS